MRANGGRLAAVTVLTMILGLAGPAVAQRDAGPGPATPGAKAPGGPGLGPMHGMGPGMMGGYGMGPGMMGGYGMGPGMMGGYGMGPGMMGGYGMGPGMMGGYGMSPGMMGGWGMGPGMGGYGLGGIGMLDLSAVQRTKINAIADDLRKKHWALLGQIQDDEAKLRDLSAQAEPDPKAVGSVYVHMSKLRQQMIDAHETAMDQARAVLTLEQRDQFDRWQLESWGPRHPGHAGVPKKP